MFVYIAIKSAKLLTECTGILESEPTRGNALKTDSTTILELSNNFPLNRSAESELSKTLLKQIKQADRLILRDQHTRNYPLYSQIPKIGNNKQDISDFRHRSRCYLHRHWAPASLKDRRSCIVRNVYNVKKCHNNLKVCKRTEWDQDIPPIAQGIGGLSPSLHNKLL